MSDTTQLRRHMWVSNAAFARLTGIKKVCMDCGQPWPGGKECPGKREPKP